ncbi:titin-like isoform X4 [Anguilla anguilla]|uniref:titin-like isoform X4 n=1 Tax=Anguilla anguilla TaxID=7936 RepID=UPI0015B2FDC9|nr:titin-like isoform X4 [Anguilla anguilla]
MRVVAALAVLLGALSYSNCVELTQPGSMVLKPGETLSVPCKVSYSVTGDRTAWIRQPAGKALEWIGIMWAYGSTSYKDSLKSKFTITRDTSSNTVILQGSSLQTGDTAVYYCARVGHYYAFDYWGKGTKVTVTTGTKSPPSVFPLISCGPGSSGYVTVGCMAKDFTPDLLTFKWNRKGGAALADTDFLQYPSVQSGEVFTAVSHAVVKAADWNQKQAYECSAEYDGKSTTVEIKMPEAEPPIIPKMSLFLEMRSDSAKAKTVTLVCSLTGFYPKEITVEWEEDTIPIQDSKTVRQTKDDDKTFSQTNQLDIDNEKWLSGSEYTCKVTHKSNSEKLSTSICSTHPTSPPSLQLESAERNDGFTVTCKVFTAYKSKVRWISDGSTTEDSKEYEELKDSENRLQGFQHHLPLTKDKWKSVKSLTCEVQHKCFGTVRGTINITALKPTFPSMIKLYRQLGSDPAEANKVTLVCSLTGFYPKEITVEWEEDKIPIQGSKNARIMVNDDKTFSQTNQLNVDNEKWLSGSEYTCKVTHKSNSKKLSTSICSTHPTSPPSLQLESAERNDGFTVTCKVFTAYKSKVRWISDGSTTEDSKEYEELKDSENRLQGFQHHLPLTKDKWKSVKSLTCEVQHKCFGTVRGTINITALKPTFPSMIKLYRQLRSDPAEANKVTLVCSLTGFYPKEITVEWEEDKIPIQGSKNARIMVNDDKTFSQTNQLNVDNEKWLSGSEYTCKVTHKSNSKKLSTSICSTHPTSPPSLQLESAERNDGFTVTCKVFTAYKSKVRWISDGSTTEDSKEYEELKDSENRLQGFQHHLPLTKDKWKSVKSLTCEVQHKCFGTVRGTINITGETSVELYLQQGPQRPGRKVQKGLCLVSGFNPQVRWQLESVEKPAAASRTVTAKNGRTVVASEIEVLQQEWIKGVLLTCVVEDQALVKPISKNVSICTLTPPSSQTAELFLTGPPLRDTRKQKGLPFVCLLVGFDTSYFTITWKVNGMRPLEGDKREPPSRNDNGTETVRSTLDAKRSDWRAGSRITCEARHLCSDKPLERHLVKAKDTRPPTVKVLAPSDSELVESSNASLLCVASDLSPSQADVHWELNGERLPASRYSSSPPLQVVGSNNYVMHSWLLVPGSERAKGGYSCVVTHDSSETPVNHTISDVFASVTRTPPHAVLLWLDGGLICLVHGFSPAAINVTWVLNSREELLEYNTSDVSRGADGKFTIWSYLRVSWQPGARYTCTVAHVTKNLSITRSQPDIGAENEYFNENTQEPPSADSPEELWNTVYAFLGMFIIALFYSITVTLALMK